VWGPETVLSLPDLGEMEGLGDVDEADAEGVAVGQKVTIRLEARPDLDIQGTVRSIGRTVRRKSWRVPTKVYKVEIALGKTDPTLMRPAMRFRGEIETARVPSVVLVPKGAVFPRASGPVAWVRHGFRYVETPLRLGRGGRRGFEVLEGLGDGDRVLPVDLAVSGPSPDRRASAP